MTGSAEPAAAVEFRLAPGFRAAAAACGLKESGAPDLALIAAAGDCAAAGVFTTNRVQAAPVILDREIPARGAGAVRAAIANSGCANAVSEAIVPPGRLQTRLAAPRARGKVRPRPRARRDDATGDGAPPRAPHPGGSPCPVPGT